MVRIVLGIVSYVLILSGFFLGITFPDGINMGDIILQNLGLNPWSNSGAGYHYTVLYSFIMVFVGWLLAKKTILNENKTKTETSKKSILISLALIAPIILILVNII